MPGNESVTSTASRNTTTAGLVTGERVVPGGDVKNFIS